MQNQHRSAIVVETKSNAPLSDSKSVFGRRDALKPQDVTFGLALKRFHRLPDPMLFPAVKTGQLLQRLR